MSYEEEIKRLEEEVAQLKASSEPLREKNRKNGKIMGIGAIVCVAWVIISCFFVDALGNFFVPVFCFPAVIFVLLTLFVWMPISTALGKEDQPIKAREYMINMFREMKDISKTAVLAHSVVKDSKNAISRGVIGEMFLGTAAGVGAAMTGKNIKITTFLIVYKDGTRTTKEVQDGSDWYNEYIKFLDV